MDSAPQQTETVCYNCTYKKFITFHLSQCPSSTRHLDCSCSLTALATNKLVPQATRLATCPRNVPIVKIQPASAAEKEVMSDATVQPLQLAAQEEAQVAHATVAANQVTSLATVHLTAEEAQDSVETKAEEAAAAAR